MICSLSGQQTNTPVISAISGKVFEKSVLEAWVAEKGTDPINGSPLTKNGIIELDISLETPPITEISIPRTLEALNASYNAIVLENYQLKQELVKTRQSLSTQLYRNDAAISVVSRLKKERDDARDALVALTGVNDVTSFPVDDLATETEDKGSIAEEDWSSGTQTYDEFTDQIYARKKQMVATRKTHIRRVSRKKLSPTVSKTPVNAFKASVNAPKIILMRNNPMPQFSVLDSVDSLESYRPVYSDLKDGKAYWGAEHELAVLTGVTLSVGKLKYVFESAPKDIQFHSATGAYVAHTATGFEFILFKDQEPSKIGELLIKALTFTLHPDGDLIIYAREDGRVDFFSLVELYLAASLSPDAAPISIVASNLGYLIAYLTPNGVFAADLRNEPLTESLLSSDGFESLSFDDTGLLLAATGANAFKMWKYDVESQTFSEVEVSGPTGGDSVAWVDQEAFVLRER